MYARDRAGSPGARPGTARAGWSEGWMAGRFDHGAAGRRTGRHHGQGDAAGRRRREGLRRDGPPAGARRRRRPRPPGRGARLRRPPRTPRPSTTRWPSGPAGRSSTPSGSTVRTSVTLAFPRSPTLTAYAAWDLAALSGGRFQLGLGTQIRQNIEDRYGMTWSEPVARMRDYVGALARPVRGLRHRRAGSHHEGPHYRLTRLQPYFNPGPSPDGRSARPPGSAASTPGICQLAGELADGFVTHPTNSSPRYLEAICLPNLGRGARGPGGTRPTSSWWSGTRWSPAPTAPSWRPNASGSAGCSPSSTPPRPTAARSSSTAGRTWPGGCRPWSGPSAGTTCPAGHRRGARHPGAHRHLRTTCRRCSWRASATSAQGVLLSPPAHPSGDDRFAAVVAAVRSA